MRVVGPQWPTRFESDRAYDLAVAGDERELPEHHLPELVITRRRPFEDRHVADVHVGDGVLHLQERCVQRAHSLHLRSPSVRSRAMAPCSSIHMTLGVLGFMRIRGSYVCESVKTRRSGERDEGAAVYCGPSKLTSTFSSSTRSSTSAEEVSARLSASSRGAAKKLRGQSRWRRTTLISAAKIVSCAPR